MNYQDKAIADLRLDQPTTHQCSPMYTCGFNEAETKMVKKERNTDRNEGPKYIGHWFVTLFHHVSFFTLLFTPPQNNRVLHLNAQTSIESETAINSPETCQHNIYILRVMGKTKHSYPANECVQILPTLLVELNIICLSMGFSICCKHSHCEIIVLPSNRRTLIDISLFLRTVFRCYTFHFVIIF